MAALSEDKAIGLLGVEKIAGTDAQRQKLFLRLGELVELNGEQWVRDNKEQLIREWETIIQQGYLKRH